MNYVLERVYGQIISLAAGIVKNDGVYVEPANPKFGADIAIPCFKLAAELKKDPSQIAKELAAGLQSEHITKAQAVNGYVNIWLSDAVLAEALEQALRLGNEFGAHTTYQGQEVVIEHTDPNPFKELHIGHAYSNTVGEALGRLYKAAGATVHQVSYHGDVGMHIAMAVWGITTLLAEGEGDWFEGGDPAGHTMDDVAVAKRTAFMGAAYAQGATAFKQDEQAAAEIKAINTHIYQHDDEGLTEIYETGKRWSFDYFDDVYQQLGTAFEKRYLESEVAPLGLELITRHKGRVFEDSNGAVVFKGEKVNLHTRVFVNNKGLPTYEAKELGLTLSKFNDFPALSQSVVVTANEIDDYFKVLIAAMQAINPTLAAKMKHISHGMVRLTTGKMSSRTGQVVRAVDVLAKLKEAILANHDTKAADAVKLAALKYAFLKQRIAGDIVFDINESVSLEGNSGPYVQYAHARGRGILAKVGKRGTSDEARVTSFDDAERGLVVKILAYPEATEKAIAELAPQVMCTYLYELTQTFNHFYEHSRVIGDVRQAHRLTLVQVYCQVLKNGLSLLNIPAPEQL